MNLELSIHGQCWFTKLKPMTDGPSSGGPPLYDSMAEFLKVHNDFRTEASASALLWKCKQNVKPSVP